jgi:hypothetical protein
LTPDPLVADLGRGTATADATDTLTGVEGITGTNQSDEIRGDAAANHLEGLGWVDLLDGRDVDDVLAPGSDRNKDFLSGGAGSDTLDESPAYQRGDDLANRVYGGSGDDAVDLAAGDDSVRGGPGTDLGSWLRADPGRRVLFCGAHLSSRRDDALRRPPRSAQ